MIEAKRLIVVRHGNTFAPGEAPRRIGAASDLPLTAVGLCQATALGRALERSGTVIDALLTGPLRRTMETADLIATALGGHVASRVVPWLCEIDHGEDEGRSEDEVLARVGRPALDAWDRRAVPPPGWSVDVAAIERGWSRLLSGTSPTTIVAVTSSGVARFAPLTGNVRNRPALLKMRTGSYGVIEQDAAGSTCICWDVRPADEPAPLEFGLASRASGRYTPGDPR